MWIYRELDNLRVQQFRAKHIAVNGVNHNPVVVFRQFSICLDFISQTHLRGEIRYQKGLDDGLHIRIIIEVAQHDVVDVASHDVVKDGERLSAVDPTDALVAVGAEQLLDFGVVLLVDHIINNM
jgi:hypothetical protein